jgi:putative transposase
MTRAVLTELPEQQCQRACDRYQALRPRLARDVLLARVVSEASMPPRTAQRWVSRYQRFGLAGRAALDRRTRASAAVCQQSFAA